MTIELSREAADEDLATVRAGMRAYEVARLPDLPPESEDVPVHVMARDDAGPVIGGLIGNVYWNGLEIEVLWVDAAHRRLGLGAALIARAEAFAREHAAVIAYLRTVDARGFYERQGYQVYGTLEDRPIGTVLYHMKKRLDG